jgi:hypothetical protein
MSNWDSNEWVLSGDNVARMLVKPGAGNSFWLESFTVDGRNVWRLKYVAHQRPMRSFWYGCVFEEKGTVAPTMTLPGGAKLDQYSDDPQSWMNAGSQAATMVDLDKGNLQRLVTLVNFEDASYSISLYRIAGVLKDNTEVLYVRLRKVFAPGLQLAPDGGGIGRGK